MKQKFDVITSTCVPLPLENVDTDQIIPARFLKATDKEGFGENLFRDWRYNKDGSPKKEVIINDPEYLTDAERLGQINRDITEYSQQHNLMKAPNPIKVFFRPGDDRRIREINEELEEVIEDLSTPRPWWR